MKEGRATDARCCTRFLPPRLSQNILSRGRTVLSSRSQQAYLEAAWSRSLLAALRYNLAFPPFPSLRGLVGTGALSPLVWVNGMCPASCHEDSDTTETTLCG